MISDAKITRIRELLAYRMSQRKIAREVGVSRGTVAAVSLGRVAEGRRTCKRYPNAPTPPAYRNGGPVPEETKRCPECGGLALAPCYLCAIRAVKGVLRAEAG